MNGNALFWLATAVLIGEGVVGPATATYFIVGLVVTLLAIARQAAVARRQTRSEHG